MIYFAVFTLGFIAGAILAFVIGLYVGKSRVRAELAEAHDALTCQGECRCWDRGYKAGWSATTGGTK